MKIKLGIFHYILLFIILIFTFIYLMINMGYYEYASYKKKVFTEEQIEKFEEDIKNGKDIDLIDYTYDENSFTPTEKRLPLRLSEQISKYTKRGVNIIFKYLNKIMN